MNKIEEMLTKKQTIDEEVLSLMSKISECEKVYNICKAEIQTQNGGTVWPVSHFRNVYCAYFWCADIG